MPKAYICDATKENVDSRYMGTPSVQSEPTIIQLRAPTGGLPLSPDPARINACKEHFEPLITRMRTFCEQLGLDIRHESSYIGEVIVDGSHECLMQLRALLQEENLLRSSLDHGRS